MNIVEKFVLGKNPDQDLCEDGIFCSENFVAIVDGATAKSTRLFDGKTSGKLAMELIVSAISQLSRTASCEEAFAFISKIMQQYYIKNNLYDDLMKYPSQRPTASVIIYSDYHKQIWSVGDCVAWVDGKEFKSEKLIDKIMTDMRAYCITSYLVEGHTEEEIRKNDIGREFIKPMLAKQCYFQNSMVDTDYSFIVVDGTQIPTDKIIKYDVSRARKIVLSSDGYTKLFSTLAETEKELERIITSDPLCYKENKGTKAIIEGNFSFDDRSYVSFEI